MRLVRNCLLIGGFIMAIGSFLFLNFDFRAKRQIVYWRISSLQQAVQRPGTDLGAMEKLMDFAEGGYQFGACAALGAIAKCGSEVAPFVGRVAKLLDSPNPFISRSAAIALSELGEVSRPARSTILRVAMEGNPLDDTTWYSVQALGTMGEQDCHLVEELRQRLGHCEGLDLSVRRAISQIENCCHK